MKVFISWSGPISKNVAQSLTDWLGNVIQAVKPWMSAENIEKGARWSSEIALQLEESKFGIICVTPDNINAPWLNFEAGALSKTIDDSYVAPYLFGLEPADLTGPLVQFQITRSNKADTKQLIHTINQALGDEALSEKKLDEIFELYWPELQSQFERISLDRPEALEHARLERDIIEEILGLARKLDKDVSNIIVQNAVNRQISDLRNRVERLYPGSSSDSDKEEMLANWKRYVQKLEDFPDQDEKLQAIAARIFKEQQFASRSSKYRVGKIKKRSDEN